MRTSNPSLKEDTFSRYAYLTGVDPASRMTVMGTTHKALFLMAAALSTSIVSWFVVQQTGPASAVPWSIGGALGGFVVALIVVFKPTAAPVLAPIYALLEGCFLGAFSAVLNKSYPGIPLQAVAVTFGVSFGMLLAYQNKVIRATPTFRKVIVSATMGIAVVYLISLGLAFFGQRMPIINDATPLGIGVSVVILIVAALNLVLDFDMIEKGAEEGAPKFMEWYGAFSLVVTLVWIYVESLRLLRKLRQ
jgi:uncharacterized YccA/Bax inhibitor family protein